ncbi:MAG TPA: Gfo/Idh/MocA family oxidoreductase, partial [Tepidisphaeraceae bacterium]|nr:Gfo/Idh/MocA family oxidoreductase [Tepidisphaeraceae bacterium]
MTPLRFAIAGCGGIAGLHAECLRRLASEGLAQLVGGFDRTERRRAEFGAKWSVPMVASMEELLARDEVDAVIITTPSGTHGELAAQVANSGRHVLVEKPLDLRLNKADAAIAAAKRAGVTLGGVSQQRFIPAVAAVKRAIDAGYFGQIVLVHSETPWYRPQSYYDSAGWRGTWAFDGGVLANQGTHMIDRLLWLAGDVDQVLSATLECGRGRNVEVETLAVATIRLFNGALGTITGTTLAYDGLPQRIIICGTEGSCAFSGDGLVAFKTLRPMTGDAPVLSSSEGQS